MNEKETGAVCQKVLVTGATGFVGQAFTRFLEEKGVAWQGTARLPAPNLIPVTPLNRDTDWRKALHGCDHVVHLAGRAHQMDAKCRDVEAIYRQVNADATEALARQAADMGVRRLVFVSSIKVNGERTLKGRPFTANDSPDPRDPYARSKWLAEQRLWAVSQETGLPVVVIRPPLVYGPGVKGNLALLAKLLEQGWPLPVGSVRNQRDLVSVGNLCDLILHCLHHPEAPGSTLLVSDGRPLSTPELVRLIAQGLGVSARIWPFPVWLLRGAASLLGRKEVVERLSQSLEVNCHPTRTRLGWRPPEHPDVALPRAFEKQRIT